MADLLKAFISFLTDIFAAIAEFIGAGSSSGGIFGDIISGNETTTQAAE